MKPNYGPVPLGGKDGNKKYNFQEGRAKVQAGRLHSIETGEPFEGSTYCSSCCWGHRIEEEKK